MSREGILKISSSKGKCLGTGFVIDKDEKGVFIATCGHVVETCGTENILVDEQEASVIKNYYDEGLDIAILYLSKVKINPLDVIYDTQSKKVEVEGFTYFGKDIKKEGMINIGAKYNVEIERGNQRIEIIRLTSKEKITSGYSGSPVISENTGMVVGMVIVEAREKYTNYAISSKHLLDVYALPILSPKIEEKSKEKKFSLDKWVKVFTIVAVPITFLAWIFPSPLNYFKEDNLTKLSEKKMYHYWGTVSKSNIDLPGIVLNTLKGKELRMLTKTDKNGNFDFNSTIKDIRVLYTIGNKQRPMRTLIEGEQNELE